MKHFYRFSAEDNREAQRLLRRAIVLDPKTFDLLGSKEKELFWIEGTTRRFKDGYNHFGRHPEKVLGFLDQHVK